MENILCAPQGEPMGVVIIPYGYADLPEDRRKQIVPIYIEALDRYGNVIDPVWINRGVVPIRSELTDLAQGLLGDRRMVSDIVQPSVHKAWYRHGSNAGDKPHAQIWRRALEEARNQAAGGWRERKFRVIHRSVEELERCLPGRAADPRDYALLYERRLRLRAVEIALEEEGLEEMAHVYDSLLLGETWGEISSKVGRGEEALKRRFYRFCKRFRPSN
jgi:DNA-directed RNA polymerase specialized sigma24 family protein